MRTYGGSGLLLVLLGACTQYPGEPAAAEDSLCGDGSEVSRDGHVFCAYTSSSAGDGFSCPAEVPSRYDGDGYVVCADVQGLTSDDVDAVAKAAGVDDGGAGGSGGAGGAGAGGAGGATQLCTDHQDCYPAGYCASDGTCYGAQPGAPGNGCDRVDLAPPQDPSGPVIFDIGQEVVGTGGDVCAKSPAACANNGNVCEFLFDAYDPDGDLARSHIDIYRSASLVEADGTLIPPYDILPAAGSAYFLRVCFDESVRTVSGVVLLRDLADHNSNALCFEGTAP